IADVAAGTSDLGVIFISDRTEHYIIRSLEEKNLVFEPLITLHPHVFMRKGHPLASEASLTMDSLRSYPHVVFTQSESNLNYAEEAVYGSGIDFERIVYVSDRASIYNIMVHTDCVSTGSGVLPEGYADERLIAVPLEGACDMRLGTVHRRRHRLSEAERKFIEILRRTSAETE
ncbi:MAG: substrate-binding domain-containing protein, partial [Firmicutes bacterium]|nr:substrate-binding domain-containing protein [Bacillota bacterium]